MKHRKKKMSFRWARERIRDALDPVKVPSRGVSLLEMSPERQAELRTLYERKPEKRT